MESTNVVQPMESQLIPTSQPSPAPLVPKTDIVIRPGVMADVPFLDSLQRIHTKQVGWMPTQQFEGKIKLGHVLVAVAATPASPCTGPSRVLTGADDRDGPTRGDAGVAATEERVGYLIGNDQYFKRDDVGVIYQMNVLPGRQRGLIGASLLKAQFERSAWGCNLYCCWCAQDIAANKFWESMGFVPLAFRAGSEKKSRVHIFWQKRIRQNDTTTAWWFPSKTGAGSLREDRIVLPIPPGTHWSDAKPLIFPTAAGERAEQTPALSGPIEKQPRAARAKKTKAAAIIALPVIDAPVTARRNGLTFDIPLPGEPLPIVATIKETPAKAVRAKAEKVKRICDPRLVSAARELRDRWLEQVNATPLVGHEKYAIARRIEDATTRVSFIDAPALPMPIAA